MTENYYPPISPLTSGVKGKCPRCGRGKFFDGFSWSRSVATVAGSTFHLLMPVTVQLGLSCSSRVSLVWAPSLVLKLPIPRLVGACADCHSRADHHANAVAAPDEGRFVGPAMAHERQRRPHCQMKRRASGPSVGVHDSDLPCLCRSAFGNCSGWLGRSTDCRAMTAPLQLNLFPWIRH